ncbi:GDNF family receptor alpha-3 [Lepus europaeus]|uniref:GDNF family receptor alpha-3 n=1 Tax=Lepus europaeus TaxID=9983 RepID=UPI002B4602B1|nr:GDNF family receptor alpha-3 [Lepus europaeus]
MVLAVTFFSALVFGPGKSVLFSLRDLTQSSSLLTPKELNFAAPGARAWGSIRSGVVRPRAVELEGGAQDPGGRVSALRREGWEVLVGGAGPGAQGSLSSSAKSGEPVARHRAERSGADTRRYTPNMMRPSNLRPVPLVVLLLPLLLPLGAGDYELDVSPYEDTVTSKPWKMDLSKLNMLKPGSDLCLKSAMLCTLNDKCDRLRKAYVEACSGPRCQRLACLEQLRAFFEKAAEPHAQGLLLCPCASTDLGCGERRRNTIAPSCALPRVASNCLELRRLCLSDPLCRSRLADFQTHCHPMDILGTCATEQSRCLRAYLGLIGTAMTPNFVSNINTSVALSCTCRGSGNLQEECERLEASFSHNPCLMKAMAAKMRFHSQFFSQNGADSTFSVMEHQNQNPALRPQPWLLLLFSCTLILILLLSLW